jgi:hypothetical protein
MDIKEALVWMGILNVLIFLVQFNIVQINPDASQFFNYAESPMQAFDAGNYSIDTDLTGAFPESSSSISVNEQGNFFTDIYATFSSWLQSAPGVRYFLWIINAVPTTLSYWGILPQAYIFAFSWFWNTFVVLLFLLFLK